MLLLHISILQFCLLHLCQERDLKKYFNIIEFWLALKAALSFVSGLKPQVLGPQKVSFRAGRVFCLSSCKSTFDICGGMVTV